MDNRFPPFQIICVVGQTYSGSFIIRYFYCEVSVLILSEATFSVTSLVSVTGFFLTVTSSFTYGVLFTSTSSFFKGMLISSVDVTGPSEATCPSPPDGVLLSIVISSWVTGTCTVFVSVTG